jgi:sortase A
MKDKRVLIVFLVLLAMLLIGDGCWIKGKAVLAQILLQRAWQQTIAQGRPVKAWPWADTWPVARLRVPRLGVEAIVLEGDSGAVLAFGPGHLKASAQPTEAGNCALAGHRDTSFSFLADIRTGDIVSIQARSGLELRYQVVSTAVERYDQLFLEETATPWLTLITCYPFHNPVPGGPLRYIVFARVVSDPEAAVAGMAL